MSNLIAEQFYGDIATKGDIIADGTVTGTNIAEMQTKLNATTAIFTSELKTTYDGYAEQIQGLKATLLFSGEWNSSTTLNIPTATNYKYLIFSCTNDTTSYSVLFDMSKTECSGCAISNDSPSPRAVQGIVLTRSGTTFTIQHVGFFNGAMAWSSRKIGDSEWGILYSVQAVYGIS